MEWVNSAPVNYDYVSTNFGNELSTIDSIHFNENTIFTQKDNLYLTKAKFISIAFESIACPPFALNIVRKITVNHPLLGDPYVFSKKVFDSNTQLSFTRDLGYAIEENLKFLETDSNRYIELKEYLCFVRGEG